MAEVATLFPEIVLQEKAENLIGYIDRLRADIEGLGVMSEHPGHCHQIENQQKRVEQLIRELVDIGFYPDRKRALDAMRSPGEYRRLSYLDLQNRLLSTLGWYREVLLEMTDGNAPNLAEARKAQGRKTSETLRKGMEMLRRKPR